jgi:hypothetical protein
LVSELAPTFSNILPSTIIKDKIIKENFKVFLHDIPLLNLSLALDGKLIIGTSNVIVRMSVGDGLNHS